MCQKLLQCKVRSHSWLSVLCPGCSYHVLSCLGFQLILPCIPCWGPNHTVVTAAEVWQVPKEVILQGVTTCRDRTLESHAPAFTPSRNSASDLATSGISLLSVTPGTCINPLAADQGCTCGGSANKEQGQDLQGRIDSCSKTHWPKDAKRRVRPKCKKKESARAAGSCQLPSANQQPKTRQVDRT